MLKPAVSISEEVTQLISIVFIFVSEGTAVKDESTITVEGSVVLVERSLEFAGDAPSAY